MSGFGTLQQKDLPYATYCQSFDCSKITVNFDVDKCWPIFTIFNYPGYLGTVNISVEYTDGSIIGRPTDITSNVITNLTGLVDTNAWDETVIGWGTLFETEVSVGDYIMIGNALYRVYSITSDTELELTSMAMVTTIKQLSSVVNFSYDITPAFFGWTTGVFPEGSYTITIDYIFPVIYEGGQTISHSDTIQVYCEKYCCIYNKLADLADICGDCMDQDNVNQIVEALFMWGLLESYKGSAGCGDSVSLSALQARLDRYCDYQPCTKC